MKRSSTQLIRNGVRGACTVLTLAALIAVPAALSARNARRAPAKTTGSANRLNPTELEPVALKALRAMNDQLRAASSFSFTAHIMREEPGTNGQMLDFFRRIAVQVQRPDKMRLEVRSAASDVTLWYDGKTVTLMPAAAKIYTTMPAPPTIDATLTMLKNKMQAHMLLMPFLNSDPYAFLTTGLTSAHEVGIVNVNNEQLLHLAFTESDAAWQLWVTGPKQVLPHRMAIIYTKMPGQPRVNVEFSDWKLNAEFPANAFAFSKPQGASEVNWNALRPRKIQQGGKTK
jgi:hypothetical protein